VPESARITVLAGVNGAGKSTIQGAMIRARGCDYFNPDEAAGQILAANPSASIEQANAAAWQEGVRLVRRAIAERLDLVLETTLGGKTITGLLEQALDDGIEVRVWYVGLDSPERAVDRVAGRVARGGHAIPEETIRARYPKSLENLIRLLPRLAALRVFDNSVEADPIAGREPKLLLVLSMERAQILETCPLERAPAWAKPVLEAALRAGD